MLSVALAVILAQSPAPICPPALVEAAVRYGIEHVRPPEVRPVPRPGRQPPVPTVEELRKSIEETGRKCLAGDAQSCAQLGWLASSHELVGCAFAAFAKGCDAGRADDCLSGEAVYRGWRGANEEELRKATRLLARGLAALEASCAGGASADCFRASAASQLSDAPKGASAKSERLYWDGVGILERGCRADRADDCSALHQRLSVDARPEALEKLTWVIRRLCDLGDTWQCTRYAVALGDPLGLKRHPITPEEQAKLLERACFPDGPDTARCDALACKTLAGTPAAAARRSELLRRACECRVEAEQVCGSCPEAPWRACPTREPVPPRGAEPPSAPTR